MIFLLGVITIHIFKNASMFVALSERFRLSNCAHLKAKRVVGEIISSTAFLCNKDNVTIAYILNMAWLSLLK